MANGTDSIVPGELKPGKKTTELVITWVVTILGFAQVILGAILAARGGHEGLAVTLEIIGSLLAVAAQLGYAGFRTQLKKTAINAAAHVEVSKLKGSASSE